VKGEQIYRTSCGQIEVTTDEIRISRHDYVNNDGITFSYKERSIPIASASEVEIREMPWYKRMGGDCGCCTMFFVAVVVAIVVVGLPISDGVKDGLVLLILFAGLGILSYYGYHGLLGEDGAHKYVVEVVTNSQTKAVMMTSDKGEAYGLAEAIERACGQVQSAGLPSPIYRPVAPVRIKTPGKISVGCWLAETAVVVLTLFAFRKHNPYSFYILLRWAACPLFCWIAWKAITKGGGVALAVVVKAQFVPPCGKGSRALGETGHVVRVFHLELIEEIRLAWDCVIGIVLTTFVFLVIDEP